MELELVKLFEKNTENTLSPAVEQAKEPLPNVVEQFDIDAEQTNNSLTAHINKVDEQIITAANVSLTDRVSKDESFVQELLESKKKHIGNVFKSQEIQSTSEIKAITNEAKKRQESSLYERFKDIFGYFGINHNVPTPHAIFILVLYSMIFATYTLTVGVFIATVQLILRGVGNLAPGVKKTIKTLIFILILAAIVYGVYLLSKSGVL